MVNVADLIFFSPAPLTLQGLPTPAERSDESLAVAWALLLKFSI